MIIILWGLHFEKGVVFHLLNQNYAKYEVLDGKPIEAAGVIAGDLEKGEYSRAVKVKMKDIYFLLKIKTTKDIDLKYGDKIRFKGEFELADTARNYKGFNYRQYLKTKKIAGIVECDSVPIYESSNELNGVLMLSNQIRSKIRDRINRNFDGESAEILKGLLIGDSGNISEETMDYFRGSSLTHTLAISGANVRICLNSMQFSACFPA